MLKELKDFLLRGNVVDLAVAVIIGAAFGQIITSLVDDVLTPLFLNPALKAAQVEKIADLTWNGVAYGNFLSAIINFLIIGTVLFFVVKAVEKAQNLGAKAKAEEEEVAGPSEVDLLQDIKALLEKK
ncbi:large conductance mechanosensitive channel protein MscL [Streptococcus danieliae]|uniref:Large-conductance mechanosensitive channel n=1 Tax=Streptococcus danieliae TaxID=747656 RepID=A0A7X3KCK3_9STRE|nr:large conductance mechanosensitive channel protein MscL [Streptococcus danieliae]MCU0082054.1 large conductance mechanosensitive channel protein MscL [Streptococcus danieliae]MVX59665.1 large conductance mechanosensitive channel protein MscL [Streptococcus danieliae]